MREKFHLKKIHLKLLVSKKILSYFSENLTTLIDEIIYLLEPGKIETGV